MRIRKNANLSSLMFSHASGPELLQTHVCQLNQSPWDVIPFSQETYQFEGEDSVNGNGSLGDSIGAVESVASMMEDEEDHKAAVTIKKKVGNMLLIDDNHNYEMEGKREKKRVLVEEDYEEETIIDSESRLKKQYCCNKTDGKGWHCKNESKEGHTMCEHHLNLLKSYNNNNVTACVGHGPTSPFGKKPDKGIAGARRGGRARACKKGSASSNPNEFYYYSGFGPLWGKRRGDRGEGNKNEGKDTCLVAVASHQSQNTTPSSASSPVDNNEEFDYVDEDDDDEDSNEINGDSGKKRTRKPVKARSLKSLM